MGQSQSDRGDTIRRQLFCNSAPGKKYIVTDRETRALVRLFTDLRSERGEPFGRDDFKELAQQAQRGARELADAVDRGDEKSATRHLADLQSTCSRCHAVFRGDNRL